MDAAPPRRSTRRSRAGALAVTALVLVAGCRDNVTPGTGTRAPTTSPASRFPKETLKPGSLAPPSSHPGYGSGIPIPSNEAPTS